MSRYRNLELDIIAYRCLYYWGQQVVTFESIQGVARFASGEVSPVGGDRTGSHVRRILSQKRLVRGCMEIKCLSGLDRGFGVSVV